MEQSVEQIREIIHGFLQERLQPKLDKLKEGEDEKRQKLVESHQPAHWIADAARRVNQIQRITHGLKFSHPAARGSSLYSPGNAPADESLIGTHCLRQITADVVGNAAVLDVYKFLRLELEGKTLLQRIQERDPALIEAFRMIAPTPEEAEAWVQAFAEIDQPKGPPSSHKLARQIYWPLPDGQYHLLAPLFPSSLVQAQYEALRHDRFSDEAKAARNARFNNEAHTHGYREYPDLAIIKFGGTNRQNISQLNSERHGEAWLLASLPPQWKPTGLKPPCHVESIFGYWLTGFRRIREPVHALRNFLSRSGHNNLAIRRKRAELTQQVIDAVIDLAAHLQQLPPGWSAGDDCVLDTHQRYWLDPARAATDEDFARHRASSSWQARIADAFGLWLNGQLDTDRTPMSDPEREHWTTTLNRELRLFREELENE